MPRMSPVLVIGKALLLRFSPNGLPEILETLTMQYVQLGEYYL